MMLALKLQRTALFILGLHLVACDPSEDSEPSGTGGGSTTDSGVDSAADGTVGGPDAALEEGFRVFPKYMLQDVQAVVTMLVEGDEETVPCPADTLEAGGYLCDTGPLSPADAVTIWVERDGFEPAQRAASIEPLTIQPLEVHLSIEGGPTGIWSDCTSLDTFATCADVCAAGEMVCVPASCVVEEDSDALATARVFGELDCTGEGQLAATQSCNDEFPEPDMEVQAVRCCCES
ncbi:MAG: hypothetical protein KUG77_22980 [Nannocystaceae bacterium]|nr:hypothetical protein [Nannocystaceae bacterium]